MLEGFVNVSATLRPGVYALVRNGTVVYIGQGTRTMLARIEAHRSNWGKKRLPAWMPASLRGVLFDEVWVLPCKLELINELEKRLIEFYHPRYNIKLKPPTPMPLHAILTHPQQDAMRR